MTKTRITDAIASSDVKTKRWKATLGAARMAYQIGEFRQAEGLLARATEMARELPEKAFALNASEIGWAAVMLAGKRAREAAPLLKTCIGRLEGCPEPALQELLAVALRFHAQSLCDQHEERNAEMELKRSAEILHKLGPDASVQLAYTLADLCGLYLLESRYSEAQIQITRAMKIAETVLGPDSPEYMRADMIYEACSATLVEDERLDTAFDGIARMEYAFGSDHPNIKRALDRYFKVLAERGDTVRLEAAKQRFGRQTKR